MTTTILYESEQVLAIDKPPGLAFHRSPEEDGVLQWLRDEIGVEQPLYPVHRLDKITSGIMLLARSKAAAHELSEAFAHKRIEKRYVALSASKPNRKQGRIIGDMVRSRRSSWKLTRDRKSPAITRFLSYAIADRRPGLRAFLLAPQTGKTHQLRVAMKSLGAPILGDGLYGPAAEAQAEERAYLHACAIGFPMADQWIELLCPPSVGAEFTTEPFWAAWERIPDLFRAFD